MKDVKKMVDVNRTLDPHVLDDMKILDQLNAEIKSVMVQLQNIILQKKQMAELMSGVKEGKVSEIDELVGGSLIVKFKDDESHKKDILKILQERWTSFDNVEKGLLEQKRYRSDQLCEQLSKIHHMAKDWLISFKAEHLLKPPEVMNIESPTFTEELPSLKEEIK